MKLVNGKFYEGDKVVPLEFGNKEQIRLIRKADEKIESLKGDGLFIETHIHPNQKGIWVVWAEFECVCGVSFQMSSPCDDGEDADAISGTYKCKSCKKKYIVDEDPDMGEFYIKFA